MALAEMQTHMSNHSFPWKFRTLNVKEVWTIRKRRTSSVQEKLISERRTAYFIMKPNLHQQNNKLVQSEPLTFEDGVLTFHPTAGSQTISLQEHSHRYFRSQSDLQRSGRRRIIVKKYKLSAFQCLFNLLKVKIVQANKLDIQQHSRKVAGSIYDEIIPAAI